MAYLLFSGLQALTVERVSVSDSGGGILIGGAAGFTARAPAVISDCTFTRLGNVNGQSPMAVQSMPLGVILRGCRFVDNPASAVGLQAVSVNVTMLGTSFINTGMTSTIAVINNYQPVRGVLWLRGCEFRGNQASTVITHADTVSNSMIRIEGCTFANNTAVRVISTNVTQLTTSVIVTNNTFFGNNASDSVLSVLQAVPPVVADISGNRMVSNTARSVITYSQASGATVLLNARNSVFTDNVASGAVFMVLPASQPLSIQAGNSILENPNSAYNVMLQPANLGRGLGMANFTFCFWGSNATPDSIISSLFDGFDLSDR